MSRVRPCDLGSTIFHQVDTKFCKTKIRLLPAKAGDGVKANEILTCICELAGIKDIKSKVWGSHHPLNTVRAMFEAGAYTRPLFSLT